MASVNQTPGPLSASPSDSALLNSTPRSGWLGRLRHFWSAHPSRVTSASANRVSASLTSPDLTAFVLLGGGSRGAAQAGAIATVIKSGVRPDVIIGVSAGAWNGAYLAVEPTPERAEALCDRSEEYTSELQSHSFISYAVFC